MFQYIKTLTGLIKSGCLDLFTEIEGRYYKFQLRISDLRSRSYWQVLTEINSNTLIKIYVFESTIVNVYAALNSKINLKSQYLIFIGITL